MSTYESGKARRQSRARRDQERRQFSRNQALGLLAIAAAILVYRLLHTPAGWIFPTGWWRFW